MAPMGLLICVIASCFALARTMQLIPLEALSITRMESPSTLVASMLTLGNQEEIGRASCRERNVSVRVDLGGRRIIKKKKTTTEEHKSQHCHQTHKMHNQPKMMRK